MFEHGAATAENSNPKAMTPDTSIQTALETYVSHTLCEKCRTLLSDDDPQEWQADREAKGICSRCRNPRPRYRKQVTEREYWPSVEDVAYVEKEFVSPNHYA